MNSIRKKSLTRIAVIMLSAIGDAVHVLPFANALRKGNPELNLTWIIHPTPYQLVYNHPAFDNFIIVKPPNPSIWSFSDLHKLWGELRSRPFDLVICLQVYLKAGLLTWLTRASAKLGFDRQRARDLNWLFTNEKIPPHGVQHVQDQYFEFLGHLHVKRGQPEWGLVITEEERRSQRSFFDKIEKPVCSVVISTSKKEKDWSIQRYIRLLEIIEGDFGFQTLLIGGDSPKERRIASKILRLTKAKPLNVLENNLRRLLYLIEGSQIVISPDTGPLHIARAMETPVIGLYGYTNPKRSGPYQMYQDLIVDGYARFPGEKYPISRKYRPNGMGRVLVQNVIEKFELALSRYLLPCEKTNL